MELQINSQQISSRVSEMLMDKFGVQRWSRFQLYPVDGDFDALSVDEGLDHDTTEWAFEWKRGTQYWWTNVHDIGTDRHTQEGKQMRWQTNMDMKIQSQYTRTGRKPK
jgi:hypothetical protein